MSVPGEVPRKPPLTSGQVVFLAIVALIAWQCINTYDDWLVRSRVTEVLQNGAALKPEIERALREKRPVVISAMPRLSPHTRGIEVTPGGEIVMELAPEVAGGGKISWKPTLYPHGNVGWECSGVPDKYWPALCRGVD